MSGNIIRQDLIQLSFDFDNSSFKQISNLANEFASSFNQTVLSSQKNIDILSTGLNNLTPNFNFIKDSIDNLDTGKFADLNNISYELSDTLRNVDGNLVDMCAQIIDIDNTGFYALQNYIGSSANSVRNFLSSFTDNMPNYLYKCLKSISGLMDELVSKAFKFSMLLPKKAVNSINGSVGETDIRDIILSLELSAKKSNNVAKALKKLSVGVYDADKNIRPLNDIFNFLNASFANMADAEISNIKLNFFKVTDMKSVIALSDFIEKSNNALENMDKSMNVNLKSSLLSFNSALDGVQIAVFEELASNNLQNLFNGVIGSLSNLTVSIMRVGLDILSNLFKGIQNNKDVVVNGLLSIKKTFVSGLLEILPQVLNLGANIIQTLATGMLNQKNKLKSLVFDLGLDLADTVFKVFNGERAAMARLEQFGDIFYSLIKAAKNFVDFVSACFKPITGIVEGIVSVFTLWKTSVSAVNSTLKINDSIMKAKETENILLATKEKLLNNAVWLSATAFESQTAVLKPAVSSVWNSLKENFVKVSDWFNANVVQLEVNLFKALFEKTIDIISSNLNKIKEFDLGAVTGIANSLNSIASAISNIFNSINNIWKNMTDKISLFLQNIWSDITSKFSTILSWILNLKQKFIDSGKNIMQGLISGITSKISEMTESIKSIETGVSDSVKNIFGIYSPSKEMFKLGWFIGEGLNRGIENTKRNLQNTVFSISGNIEENIVLFSKTKNTDNVLNNNDSDFPSIRTPENSPCLTRNFYNENNTYSPVLNLEINGTNLSTRELKRLIKESFKEFEQESNESFIRRNPRLTYV